MCSCCEHRLIILLTPERRLFPNRITTCATACVFVFNFNILAGAWVDFSPVKDGGPLCVVQGVVFHVSLLGIVLYWGVIALVVNAVVVQKLLTHEAICYRVEWAQICQRRSISPPTDATVDYGLH